MQIEKSQLNLYLSISKMIFLTSEILPVKGLHNVKFICVGLCSCVSVDSLLQLCNWCRESKNRKENALLLGNH